MSYKLVDAVNQQMPETVKPTEMLILTKFAELVVDPKKPFRRVGLERFRAMTHAKDKETVTRNLDALHEKELLICHEPRGKKKPGDLPTLYELRLPEGFDEATVKARHDKYYFGKPFKPKYFEDNDEFNKPSGSLSPVMREGETGKIPPTEGKIPTQEGKIPPSQVSGSQVFFFPDDDDVVKAAKEEAVKATGSQPLAFDKCGITAGNAQLVRETIEGFVALRQARPDYTMRSPVGFLIDRIKTAIANGTTEGLFGELPKANNATDKNKAEREATWNKIVTELDLMADDVPKDKLSRVERMFMERFAQRLPGKGKLTRAVKFVKAESQSGDDRVCNLSGEIEKL